MSETMAGRQWIWATGSVSRVLAARFRKSYPAFYNTHVDAFNAGRWYTEAEGAWLGAAIVYKLQTTVHIDASDGILPVAVFCFGQFEGGYLELPDLGLRFL